jgi:hypothetical protein
MLTAFNLPLRHRKLSPLQRASEEDAFLGGAARASHSRLAVLLHRCGKRDEFATILSGFQVQNTISVWFRARSL